MGCNCGKGGSGTVIINDPAARMAICRKCPSSKLTPLVGLTCGTLLRPVKDDNGNEIECGCILNLKTKIKNQRCPQGKW